MHARAHRSDRMSAGAAPPTLADYVARAVGQQDS
jgi:hypothetical protein